MSDFEIKITDNADTVLKELETRMKTALEAMGLQGVSYAKLNLEKDPRRVDTGRLRNSITHLVKSDESAVYIGTNVDYAPYVEYGTGIHRENNPESGSKTWWVYVKGNTSGGHSTGKRYTYKDAARIVASMRAQGIDAHMTQGMKPNHFIKNAIMQHKDEYKALAEKYIKGK